MKVVPTLLMLSLAGNLMLSAWEYSKHLQPCPSWLSGSKEDPVNPPRVSAGPVQMKPEAESLASLESLRQRGDFEGIKDSLRKAGMNERASKAILLALVQEKYERLRTQEAAAPGPELPYWKGKARESREQRRARMEKWESLRSQERRELEELGLTNKASKPQRYAYLEGRKSEELCEIEKDYQELREKLFEEMGGFELPSDRKRLKMLQEEETKDRKSLLSEQDEETIRLRESGEAREVLYQYSEYLESEAEFKQAYAIVKERRQAERKSYDDDKGGEETRRLARKNAEEKLSQLLGQERMTRYTEENDPDRHVNQAAIERLKLPAGTEKTLIALRENLRRQAGAIQENGTLGEAERQWAVNNLRNQLKNELCGLLGAEGAETYMNRSIWVRQLPKVEKNGKTNADECLVAID